MHYYAFNIADYRKDTTHLSRLEHGIYRDLIDWYYLEEKPIPKETHTVMRRLRLATEVEKEALQNVLSDFFKPTDEGFKHDRIDEVIAEYHLSCEKNRKNGQKGGRPKGKKTQPVSSGLPDETQPKGNQEPITNNHKPLIPPTPPAGEAPSGAVVEAFDKFWNAWPKSERKQDKAKCLKKWTTDKLADKLAQILADIELKRKTKKWTEGFIEAPLVYLNGQRWNDGVQPDEPMATGALDPDSRAAVEARGVACGVGKWAEGTEQWGVYKNRVNAASRVEA